MTKPAKKQSNNPAAAKTRRRKPAETPVAQELAVPRGMREGTKQMQLIAMLKRSEGVTVDEAASTLAWQRHTVRGALAGALKKKLGLIIQSEKVEGRGRVYRIAG